MDKVICIYFILLCSSISFGLDTGSGSESKIVFLDHKKQSQISVKACKEYVLEACRGSLKPLKKGVVSESTSILNVQQVVSNLQKYPFKAVIGYGKHPNIIWWCSGSLIHKQYVLSSAHCAMTSLGPAQWARIGAPVNSEALKSSQLSPTEVDTAITRKIVHPDYKGGLLHDVALFQLRATISFNEYIRPVCLYPEPEFDLERLISTEWRFPECKEVNSSKIMTVINPYPISKDKCKEIFANNKELDIHDLNNENLICTSHLRIYDSSCQSSAGNPLLYLNEDVGCPLIYNQIGIQSVVEHSPFSEECSYAESHSIYTKISSYIPWIEKIVWAK